MRKTELILIMLIVSYAFVFIAGPLCLSAQEAESEQAPAEKTEEVKSEARPALELMLLPHKTGWKFFASKELYLHLIIPVILAILIKFWLLKRKLKLSWQLESMEKLFVTTAAEVIFQVGILFVLLIFFAPMTDSVLSRMSIASTGTKTNQLTVFIWNSLLILPYQCIMGVLATMSLIEVNVPQTSESRREYIWFAVFGALIVPIMMVLMNTYFVIFFK